MLSNQCVFHSANVHGREFRLLSGVYNLDDLKEYGQTKGWSLFLARTSQFSPPVMAPSFSKAKNNETDTKVTMMSPSVVTLCYKFCFHKVLKKIV